VLGVIPSSMYGNFDLYWYIAGKWSMVYETVPRSVVGGAEWCTWHNGKSPDWLSSL
jgi:hypothetical protein